MSDLIPVYRIYVQIILDERLVELPILTTEEPNRILGDWQNEYQPIGYLTAKSKIKEEE